MTAASTIHTPTSEADLAEVVQAARASATPLEIVGGGSRRSLGRPVQAAATLSTAQLSGITLYEPSALTLVAKAGTPIAEIEAALAAEGQMLPFEPMDHRPLLGTLGAEPTIGGVVACAVSGPRRVQAGACRDSLIGARFVNGAGEAIVSGGRVMKNVTGYDLVKLMAGAYGELGVLTEVSFKLQPKPEAAATLRIEGLEDAAAIRALTAALGSPFGVSAAAHSPSGGLGEKRDGAPATAIRVEGFADSVAYRATRLREALSSFGAAEIVDDAEAVAAHWAYVRDVGPFVEQRSSGGAPTAVWRLAVRPSKAAELASMIKARQPAEVFYDWGGGLVWVSIRDDGDAGAAAIRETTAAVGGDATLVRAAETTRAAVAPFPPQPAPITALMLGLKEKFDPGGVLNPGRTARA